MPLYSATCPLPVNQKLLRHRASASPIPTTGLSLWLKADAGLTTTPEQFISQIIFSGAGTTTSNGTYTRASGGTTGFTGPNGNTLNLESVDGGILYFQIFDTDFGDTTYTVAITYDQITIILPAAGESPAPTSSITLSQTGNSLVTAWQDQSGNGNNASNIIDVITGTKNAKTTAIFNGSTSELTLGNLFSGYTAMSFFAVWKITDVGNGGIFGTDDYGNMEIASVNDGETQFTLTRINSARETAGFITSGWWDNATWVTSSFRIDDSVFGEARKNGETTGITTDNGLITLPFTTDAVNYRLGRYAVDAGNYYANYELAELVIYNRVVTSTERQQVEAYLNTKYAIY
jgi:hypothetical protein